MFMVWSHLDSGGCTGKPDEPSLNRPIRTARVQNATDYRDVHHPIRPHLHTDQIVGLQIASKQSPKKNYATHQTPPPLAWFPQHMMLRMHILPVIGLLKQLQVPYLYIAVRGA